MKHFNLQSLAGTKKIFIVALFASILVTGSYCYLWFRIFEKNQAISELLFETETLTAAKENLATAKGRVEETAPTRDKMSDLFIPKDGVVAFLNKVQDLGAENNLKFKIESVTIEEEPTAGDFFENVKLNIHIEGLWSDVYRFGTLLELLPMRVFVDRTDFEIVPKKNNFIDSSKKPALSVPEWQGNFTVRILKLK